MATAVTGLIDLGNSTAEAAELTAQTDSEIRRLRKLATSAESVPTETGNDHHAHEPESESDSRDVLAAPPGPGRNARSSRGRTPKARPVHARGAELVDWSGGTTS